MRRAMVMMVLVLLAASCSGDDVADTTAGTSPTTSEGATPSSATETTGSPIDDSTTTTTPAGTEATTSTSTTTTTTSTIAPGPGVLALTRVVFGPVVYVTVTNIGNAPTELGQHWLCQRPAYVQLPAFEMQPGDTVAIGLGTDAPPDLVEYAAVFEMGAALGTISKADGEMGLYLEPSFDSPSSMVDYVEWGTSGHGRSGVAVLAGIWIEGEFVEIPPEATSISSSGAGGPGAADWFPDVGG